MTGTVLSFVSLLAVLSGSSLEERMSRFHEELMAKEVDSYSTRESIRMYFLSDDDVSNFIVAFIQKMQEKGFRKRQIAGWRVARTENRDDEAVEEVRVQGTGPWFFTVSFTFKEEWVKKDGEWYFLPPKIIPKGR